MRWKLVMAGTAAALGFVSVIVAGVHLSAQALIFWRCLFAAISLPLLLLALGRLGSLRPRRHRAAVLGLSLLLTVHWMLFFETVKRSSVAVAILTTYTAPIFVALLGPLVLPERRSRVGLVALAISAPGLALIAVSGGDGSHADGLSIALGLGAGFTYALLIIGTKTITDAVSPFMLAFWGYVLAGLAISPFLAGAGRVLPTAAELPWVMALGVLLTGGTGALYIWNLRNVTAQATGLLAYLEPVSASVLAWAILGQAVGWPVALGGAAVLAGGALVVVSETAEARAAATPTFVPEQAAAIRMLE